MNKTVVERGSLVIPLELEPAILLTCSTHVPRARNRSFPKRPDSSKFPRIASPCIWAPGPTVAAQCSTSSSNTRRSKENCIEEILWVWWKFKRPLTRFRHQQEWNQVSNNVKPGGNFVVLDLDPASWYHLRVTAHNNAGFAVAEYEFATLTVTGGKRIQTAAAHSSPVLMVAGLNGRHIFCSRHHCTGPRATWCERWWQRRRSDENFHG